MVPKKSPSCTSLDCYFGAQQPDPTPDQKGVAKVAGGVAALVGSIVIKPRPGRFRNGESKEIRGHNIELVAAGSLQLWFGWCVRFPLPPAPLPPHHLLLGPSRGTVAPCSFGSAGGAFPLDSLLLISLFIRLLHHVRWVPQGWLQQTSIVMKGEASWFCAGVT